MTFDILLRPKAVDDLRRLRAFERAKVQDAIRIDWRHQPSKASRGRIRRLQDLSHPQYALCVDDIRVSYDVQGAEVQVLGIVEKADVDSRLEEAVEPDEDSAALGSEG